MPKTININALGQAIDTTWGRSSTPHTASYSVKFTLLGGDRMLASYQVVTNFVSEKEMILMKRQCQRESDDVIAEHVKAVKETYRQLTGDSLTVKEDSSTDSLEIIGFNVHNPKRTAYFRKKTVFELV
ncbi:MAG: hypothetical protein EBR82_00645 [Caulobacteraceae bacterium]|nr:hypothetical protein [Caulobacteraceae bacterium]